MKIKLIKLKCLRCGHEWNPRKHDVRLCPKCGSIYWDRERKVKQSTKIMKGVRGYEA